MIESHTAVVERDTTWTGTFATEPYETAWALEAIFFVRILASEGVAQPVNARVEISPDGMHWCDHGSALAIDPSVPVCHIKLKHFGGWLRLAGHVPDRGSIRVIVYLTLKE